MQRAIDNAAMTGDRDHPVLKLDVTKPPTVEIGYQGFPKMVYKYPKEKFRNHRQFNQFKEVESVKVANEAAFKIVNDKAELEAALKGGWKTQAYVVPDVPEFDDEEVAS